MMNLPCIKKFQFTIPSLILQIVFLQNTSNVLSFSMQAPQMKPNKDELFASPDLERLAAHANSYASAHGVQVEKREEGKSSFTSAPLSLLPNAYPSQAFLQAQSLAPHFNVLVDKVSRDPDFLTQTLGGVVADMDPFTAKLLELYKEIYVGESADKFAAQAGFLGVHRSDYMLHRQSEKDPYQIKQVELNTISSSFASLSTNIAALHRQLISRFVPDVTPFLQENKARVVVGDQTSASSESDEGVPINPALERIPRAMKIAYDQYQSQFGSDNTKQETIILFVVQEGETNTVDQRFLEFRLWDEHQIPVVRMSLARASSEVSVDPESGALMISKTGQEIAVVYYRAGYAPTDYGDGLDGKEWQARATFEKSRATKSPALGYHLAGTKKVQQELARPGVLEKFFPGDENTAVVKKLRESFAGLYSLGGDATDEDKAAVQSVLSGGEGRYVLKPQREGGGYNFYGEDLAKKLRENVSVVGTEVTLNPSLGEFILMERLFPPTQKAILLRSGKVEGYGDTISELGCFATIVASPAGEIIHNEYAGFLLRTKFSNVDEGGVAAGFATLSSPHLC